MAITLPRVIKSAAYRSRSGSGDCALTRSSSAGNFLAFGEVVTPPCSAPLVLPLFGRRYHTPSTRRNKSLSLSQFPRDISTAGAAAILEWLPPPENFLSPPQLLRPAKPH